MIGLSGRGEPLSAGEQLDATLREKAPRCVKDLIEERLFERHLRQGGSARGREPGTDRPVHRATTGGRASERAASVNRDRPFGDAARGQANADRLGLSFTLRGSDRPKRRKNQ